MIDDKGRPLEEPSVTDAHNTNIGAPERKDTINHASCGRRSRGPLSRKYGLRPRNGLRRPIIEHDTPTELRTTFRGRMRGGRTGPLSKYRRKTANARERYRMKEINDAFSTLREALPQVNTRRTTITGMTKITTLRMAVTYIQILSDILNGENIAPTETTVALLNSSHLWNNCNKQQLNLKKETDSDTHFTISSNRCQDSKFSEIQILNEEDFIGHSSKPGWENGHANESDLVNLLNNSDCIMDNNLGSLDDFPQFTDFCWSLS